MGNGSGILPTATLCVKANAIAFGYIIGNGSGIGPCVALYVKADAISLGFIVVNLFRVYHHLLHCV
jgi:hypothetical protein